jgi:hypothetical protein
VHVVAPQLGGVVAADVAAQQILALVAADGPELVAVQFEAKAGGGERLSGGGKMNRVTS